MYIAEKIKEIRSTKISRIAIKDNVDNGGNIWKVKEKLEKVKKKKKKPQQKINSQGQELENKDGILKEFARYYKEFLKKKTS